MAKEPLVIVLLVHGSHSGWKNGRVFSSQGILPKILEESEKNYTGKLEKNVRKVREICQPVIVKTLQIWYHTLNKKEVCKILENCKKYWKSQGICQSEKVGTM